MFYRETGGTEITMLMRFCESPGPAPPGLPRARSMRLCVRHYVSAKAYLRV